MNTELKSAYQSALVRAALDDFTAAGALGNVCGGQFGPTPTEWKEETIAFIYRAMAGGLIAVSGQQPAFAGLSAETIAHFLLIEDSATTGDGPPSLIWHAVFFEGTAVLDEILLKHGIRDWKYANAMPNEIFFAEVSRLFDREGVLNGDDLLAWLH